MKSARPDNRDGTVFSVHSSGVKTGRDAWVYDFDRDALAARVRTMCAAYEERRVRTPQAIAELERAWRTLRRCYLARRAGALTPALQAQEAQADAYVRTAAQGWSCSVAETLSCVLPHLAQAWWGDGRLEAELEAEAAGAPPPPPPAPDAAPVQLGLDL